MKILVLTNLYPPDVIGGYEILCSQAVDALRQRGHDVVVLTSVPRRPVTDDVGYILRQLRTPDVYSSERSSLRSPFWEFESNLLNVENIYLLLQLLSTWQPDVCYLWNLVALGGAGIVATLEYLDIPWVWHLGDAVPAMLCNFNGELPQLGQLIGTRISGRFLGCSRTVLNTVETVVPLRGQYRIVPNWITGTTPTIKRDHFDGSSLKLAYAGRLTEEKGVFLLLDTVAQLVGSGHQNINLDMIGAGKAEELRTRILELGIEGYVHLLGWRPQTEVRQHLRGCDLFVFPAHPDDAMPLAPLEAASVGCVPLISLLSGASEWLVEGVHCLKAERSAEGFAEVIRSVLDGNHDLPQLSQRAVQAVHESFAIEAVMPEVEKELVIAAGRTRRKAGQAEDLYRMALIGDALLRRQALGQLS